MIIKNNEKENLEAKEREKRLEPTINNFEDIALKYGPVSSEELKNRINKVIKNFDKEFKQILEVEFEMFWNNKKTISEPSLSRENDRISNTDIPKFLRSYKK